MTLKTFIISAVLVMLAVGAVLVYSIMGEAGVGATRSHAQQHQAQGTQTTTASGAGSDPFGCHNHGVIRFHCH